MLRDLTKGPITKSMLLFAGPMILGNLLQQLYNIVDTLIVGRVLGESALAAVGTSFTLIVFLTSIILGLCMGSGITFATLYGAKDERRLQSAVILSFWLIGGFTVLLNIAVLLLTEPILTLMQIPYSLRAETGEYLRVIFYGLLLTFVYNYFSCLLRALGNSLAPLVFLGISSIVNIVLDLIFVITLKMGVAGAAWATITAQGLSAVLISIYTFRTLPLMKSLPKKPRFDKAMVKELAQYSMLTSVQQSVMNFGILMVQGLINSFGVTVMAAFAAAVKIDSIAYMPVQDFGNSFSTFLAQNYGAKQEQRIRRGIRSAFVCSLLFCAVISAAVFIFAEALMQLFVQPEALAAIAIGAEYLRIEGACYFAIGFLFLFYGLYRGIGKPGISIVLTIISLGTRVLLAYILSAVPTIGVYGVWWSIPIGWFLADIAGLMFYRKVGIKKAAGRE